MAKTVAVLGGTGNEGPGLARLWAKSGQYKVIIGSRQAEKGQRVAAELNAQLGSDLIEGMSNEDAAKAADLCVLTVPYSAQGPTLTGLKEILQGKILAKNKYYLPYNRELMAYGGGCFTALLVQGIGEPWMIGPGSLVHVVYWLSAGACIASLLFTQVPLALQKHYVSSNSDGQISS